MMHINAWLLSRCRDVRGIWSRLMWVRTEIVKVFAVFTSAAFVFLCISLPNGNYLAYLANPSNYDVLFGVGGFFAAVCAGVRFLSLRRVSLVFEPHVKLNPAAISVDDGFKPSEFRDQSILYRPKVNLLLNQSNNPIHFNPKLFEVHPLIQHMAAYFIFSMPETGWDTSDDAKVRLYSDLSEEALMASSKVYLQRTSYFRDRLSNTLANYRVRLKGRELLNLRQEVITRCRLISLKESMLSNQLGASTILVTCDSAIVFLRQGNRTRENPGRLAPAGSGSFDWPSPKSVYGISFQDFVRAEARRELCEECGLNLDDICEIQICGFGRYLYRNGKPEVFCIATAKIDSRSIEIPLKEWDYQQQEVQVVGFDGPVSAENVCRGLGELQSRLEARVSGYEIASGPLYWNVVFAREYLTHLGEEDATRLFPQLS